MEKQESDKIKDGEGQPIADDVKPEDLNEGLADIVGNLGKDKDEEDPENPKEDDKEEESKDDKEEDKSEDDDKSDDEIDEDLFNMNAKSDDDKSDDKDDKSDDEIDDPIDDAAPDHLSEKGAQDWNELKAKSNEKIKDAMKEAASIKQEFEEYKSKYSSGEDSEELVKLKEERDKLASQLEQVDLKNSPAFQEKFAKPLNSMKAALAEKFKEYDIPDDVDALLSKSGKDLSLALEKIIDGDDEREGLPRLEQSDVVDTVKAIQGLQHQASEAMDNASVANEALSNQFDAQTEQSFNKHFNAIAGEKGRMLDNIEVGKKANSEQREYAESYNQSIAKMEETARTIATGNVSQDEINQYATLAAWAMHMQEFGLPAVANKYNTLVGKLKSYKAEMDAMRDMNPDLSSGGSKGGGHQADDDPEGKYDPNVTKNIVQNLSSRK